MNSPTDAVQSLIDRQVAEGRQIGVQVAAYLNGRLSIECTAGTLGANDPRPVHPDSLFCSFSTTKGIAAVAVHQLIDRGLIDPMAPVAHYWPEFAQNGKAAITVNEALSHQAGLHAMPSPFEHDHITDWDDGIRRIEEASPAWAPGTAVGYHAVTYGWLLGGLVARATGRHIGEVMSTQIFEPLGISHEAFCGVPVHDPSIRERLATLSIVPAGDGLPIPDDHAFYEAMPKRMWPYFNDLRYREVCLPSANGHFTARALARIYGALANGGVVDGVRLISPAAIARMSTIVTTDVDRVLMSPIRRGLGFTMGGPMPHPDGRQVLTQFGPRESAFGHSGAGGSTAFADPHIGLGIGITINKMQFPLPGEGPTVEIANAVRTALGVS